jgi:hypothetical protein
MVSGDCRLLRGVAAVKRTLTGLPSQLFLEGLPGLPMGLDLDMCGQLGTAHL